MAVTGVQPKKSASANPTVHANVALAPRSNQPTASPLQSQTKAAGYGLPCAKCHVYYPADLDACPICHHRGRVSPVVPKQAPKRNGTSQVSAPDIAALDLQREEFLRQFKSQAVEIDGEDPTNAHGTLCALSEHHDGEEASADICRVCYERLEERIDVYEAALRIELKEAARIIYDAVWANPSDPAKTYENAAAALLAELRKRAGMRSVLGQFETLSD